MGSLSTLSKYVLSFFRELHAKWLYPGQTEVGEVFHDHLHNCEIFLARYLISFVFNEAVIEFGL